MKSSHCITVITFTAILVVLHLPLVCAEDHGERCEEPGHEHEHEEEVEEAKIAYPTGEKTLGFLREKIPVAIEVLELIREQEGEEKYTEVLGSFRDQHHEYLEIGHYDGPEAAELIVSCISLELQMDKALHELQEAEEDNEELVQRIQELVRKQWEHSRKVARMELKLIELHRAEVQSQLKELDAMDEDDLKAQVAKLIGLEEDVEGHEAEDEGEEGDGE